MNADHVGGERPWYALPDRLDQRARRLTGTQAKRAMHLVVVEPRDDRRAAGVEPLGIVLERAQHLAVGPLRDRLDLLREPVRLDCPLATEDHISSVRQDEFV
jgi:hypothetical protein